MRQALTPAARLALRRRLSPYLPFLVASSALATIAIGLILARVGHPAVPLDDSFIHFQYAARLAGGGFMSYVEGKGYTSGATSFLWPFLLAPFYLVGLRGLWIIVAAWALGTVLHAALATEASRLARPLAGPTGAAAAGAMCVSFGAFAWFAWSGMETILLGWALLRTARIASELIESTDAASAARLERALWIMALIGPLARPEGALCSGLAALAFAAHRSGASIPRRLGRAAAALALCLVVPATHWIMTGSPTSNTAAVKWLPASPYHTGGALWQTIVAHVDLLLSNILDGGTWGAIFVPEGTVYALALGAVATVASGARRGRLFRAALVLLVALGAFAPTTYLSFLWNRVRYVWPFAGAWFVMLACLAHELGCLVRARYPRATFVAPGLAGIFVGALATKLPWSLQDLAQSAHAIDRQQVALGRWARAALPADARIGVNDTGAIAYMSGRETFDVVGLTTMGEAKYWVAGAGSRFEHYERMATDALPTHFIVYPQWMGMPAVLGDELTRATVENQSILGGVSKVAYVARYDLLGSGDRPTEITPEGQLADALDVADLESEAAHRYLVLPAAERDNLAVWYRGASSERADGARFGRRSDRFVATLEAGRPTQIVLRVAADERTTLEILVDGRSAGTVEVGPSVWEERAVALPTEAIHVETSVEVRSLHPDETFGSMHYWLYQE